MKLFLILLLAATAHSEVFRYAIITEPHSLDPTETVGVDSQHLLGTIFRGLYKISDDGKLELEGAQSCRWKTNLHLICKLKKYKFSDGSSIVAEDYVRAFWYFLRKETKTTEIELLMNLKNAKSYHEGSSQDLGVKAIDSKTLSFEFSSPDPEFEYKLASPLFFPFKTPPSKKQIPNMVTNGPYRITDWDKNKISLEPNNFFVGGHYQRPKLEIRFIPDENTLMTMFDSGRLDFIRRLPTLALNKYRSHSGFIARPLSRFDYLGFGPGLKDFPALRKVMTESANYEEFRKLFDSLGRPGCPSFPESYVDHPRCYNFEKKNFAKLEHPEKPLRFLINQTGGEDLKRGAEWFQNQWSKNLQLKTSIESIEGKVFLSEIRNNPPDIFRMGVPLTRPTCLAAVELFRSTSENNLVHLNDPELDRLILKLEQTKNTQQKRKACGRALERLLKLYALIPLGQFQFFMVVSEKFKGLHINELNHLDLSQLHPVSVSK